MLFNRFKKSKVVYSFDKEYKEALSIFNEPYVYNETTVVLLCLLAVLDFNQLHCRFIIYNLNQSNEC